MLREVSSVSATFTRLRRDDLKGLVKATADNATRGLVDFLATSGTSAVKFTGRADVFSVLLPVLAEEYDIDLEVSENGIVADLAEACEALVFILTLEEQENYSDSLSPTQFSDVDLNEAYENFTEEDEKDAGKAMLACITALHQALLEVDEDHVVVAMVL